MTAPTRETDATHDLSGTYVLTAQNLTMTLVLRQDAQGARVVSYVEAATKSMRNNGKIMKEYQPE